MIAHVYIYGKGKQFQYGIERIAPALRPFQQELIALSTYHGSSSQDKSIRYGSLQNGAPYLSLAFSLPEGNQVDHRSQIRVFTFVFDSQNGCPLTRELLTILPTLTVHDLEKRVTQDVVTLETLLDLKHQGPPLPPSSPVFSLALLSTLFFQAEKGGHLTLLAQASPQDLLSAIASLPSFLWPYLSFNTDVRQVSEPLALLNAWTPEAKREAERSSYSGAAADCRRVFYPAEDGALLYMGGLEQEAQRFLSLPEDTQEKYFLDCNSDLSQLVALLRRQAEVPKTPTQSTAKGKRVASVPNRTCLPDDLRLALFLAVVGLLGLSFLIQYVPAAHKALRLEMIGDTILFLCVIVLSWAVLSGATHLAQKTIRQFLFNLECHSSPLTRTWITRLRRLLLILSCFLIPALLLAAGAEQIHLRITENAVTLVLHLGGSPTRLLAGMILSILLWGLRAMNTLNSACYRRHSPY